MVQVKYAVAVLDKIRASKIPLPETCSSAIDLVLAWAPERGGLGNDVYDYPDPGVNEETDITELLGDRDFFSSAVGKIFVLHCYGLGRVPDVQRVTQWTAAEKAAMRKGMKDAGASLEATEGGEEGDGDEDDDEMDLGLLSSAGASSGTGRARGRPRFAARSGRSRFAASDDDEFESEGGVASGARSSPSRSPESRAGSRASSHASRVSQASSKRSGGDAFDVPAVSPTAAKQRMTTAGAMVMSAGSAPSSADSDDDRPLPTRSRTAAPVRGVAYQQRAAGTAASPAAAPAAPAPAATGGAAIAAAAVVPESAPPEGTATMTADEELNALLDEIPSSEERIGY